MKTTHDFNRISVSGFSKDFSKIKTITLTKLGVSYTIKELISLGKTKFADAKYFKICNYHHEWGVKSVEWYTPSGKHIKKEVMLRNLELT
jgi:hypothetical protein